MNGKARRAIFATLIVAAWAVPGGSTSVSAEATAACTAEGDFVVNPGLSTNGSSGSFASDPGTLECKDGGKGSIEFKGNYGTKDPDTCTSGGEGNGTTIFKFADGKTVTDDGIEFTYGPFQGGALGGSWKGKSSSGTFEVTSLDGDCVSKPITKAHAVFRNVVVKR